MIAEFHEVDNNCRYQFLAALSPVKRGKVISEFTASRTHAPLNKKTVWFASLLRPHSTWFGAFTGRSSSWILLCPHKDLYCSGLRTNTAYPRGNTTFEQLALNQQCRS